MLVPVDPFRDAFLRSGRTASSVARDLGWTRVMNDCNKGHKPGRIGADISRLSRTLGIRSYNMGSGARPERKRAHRKYVRYDTALKLAKALDIDPVDVGL